MGNGKRGGCAVGAADGPKLESFPQNILKNGGVRRYGCGEGGKCVRGGFFEVSNGGRMFLVFFIKFGELVCLVFGTSYDTLSHGVQ